MLARNSGTVINNGFIQAKNAVAAMSSLQAGNLLNNGTIHYSDGTDYGILLFESTSSTTFINGETGIIRGRVDSDTQQTITSEISGTCAPAILVHMDGTALNFGTIDVNTSTGAIFVVGGGNATNEEGGHIKVEDTQFGMYVSGGGILQNFGTIDAVSNLTSSSQQNGAMFLDGSGKVTNSGTINVHGSYYAGLGSRGNNTITNSASGIIDIVDAQSKSSAFSLNGGTGVNFGRINLQQGTFAVTGGNLYNWGHIHGTGSIEVGENGKVIMEKGGTLGNTVSLAYVGQSYFPRFYSQNDTTFAAAHLTFKAEEIKAVSYVYETKGTDENTLIRRKHFAEISEKGIGNYLEYLYYGDSSLKDEFFGILRSSESQEHYDAYVDILFGRNFYPMLSFQTRNVIRSGAETLMENLYERLPEDKKTSWIGGYLYENYRQKRYDRVEGYKEDMNGLYLGKQYRYNSFFDVGGVLTYTRADSSFKGHAGKRWDNYFQGALFGNYEREGLKGMAILYGGYSQGHLTRHREFTYLDYSVDSPHYEGVLESSTADIKNSYVGLSGKIFKRYDFTHFFLEPEGKIHAMGIFQDDINESGGKYAADVKSLNKFFSQTSILLGIGKEFQIDPQNSFTLKFIGGARQDLNSERQPLRMKLKNLTDESTKIKMSRENILAGEIGVRGEIKDKRRGEFSIYADYRHIFEVEPSWRITSGIQYRF